MGKMKNKVKSKSEIIVNNAVPSVITGPANPKNSGHSLPNFPNPPPVHNLGIDDIMRLMQQQIEPSQKLLADLSNNLFDKSKLLMIARLDMNLAYYIVKHLIVINIYQEYYSGVKINKIMIRKKSPPYYGFKTSIDAPDLELIQKTAYQRFINELMQITIAFDGKGRGEILEIIKELRERIKQDTLIEQNQAVRGGRIV